MALAKAVIVNLDAPGTPPIPFMFNPPKYELSKANQFAEIRIPGLPSSVLQFVHGESRNLSMELFFDTTHDGSDVRASTSAISELAEPGLVTRAPPLLLLLWGSLAFQCFLVSVKQDFDYFDGSGIPLRATLTVSFKGYDSVQSMIAAAAGRIANSTRVIVQAGDSLQSIAAQAYNEPGLWRLIASANGVDNPRAIAPGLALQIPRRP